MPIRTLVAGLAAAVALGLAGCGENPQVTVYKQGKYQGKPDTKPWDSPEWGGKQADWERAVNNRTLSQNEYTRTGQ
ncbi:MAG: hypothetical protein U1F45_15860 [Burkholderiales bacterium]